MSSRYEAEGNSFAVKEILKVHGFRWIKDESKWVLDVVKATDADQVVFKARREIKESGIDCEIVYYGDGYVPPRNYD
jgi:hypothetical protein